MPEIIQKVSDTKFTITKELVRNTTLDILFSRLKQLDNDLARVEIEKSNLQAMKDKTISQIKEAQSVGVSTVKPEVATELTDYLVKAEAKDVIGDILPK